MVFILQIENARIDEYDNIVFLDFVFDLLHKLVTSLNISCLIATHNHELAKLTDRNIILRNGSVEF